MVVSGVLPHESDRSARSAELHGSRGGRVKAELGKKISPDLLFENGKSVHKLFLKPQ